MYICYIEMIRFSKLLVGTMFLAIAIASFGGAKAQAATPAPAVVDNIPVGATPLVQTPLRPITQLAWTEIEGIECGDEVSFDVTDIDGSLKDLLGSLITNYVMCPMIKMAWEVVEIVINSVIGPLLRVEPLMKNGDPSESGKYLYAGWGGFRDLANIGIAFAILLLVFSQATSYGLNAYGVRKLLPKIAVAAIMINLSFVICALLVDVFNILGSSFGSTIEAAISTASDTSKEDIVLLGSSGITGAMRGATAVIGITIMIVLLPILVLLGMLCVLFAIARQLLIAFLIVIAPVAIAAWMFPNTERYFSKWMSTFVKLLAIYPVVSVIQAMTLIFLLVITSLMV